MTKNELRAAADLLKMGSVVFSNHGCNDYDLSILFPDLEERNRLVSEIYEGEEYIWPEPKPGEPDWRVPDWLIMAHLARKLLDEATETKSV